MQSFADHTAEMIVSVAELAHQGDPVSIATLALRIAAEYPDELPELEGPEYTADQELADESARDIREAEAAD